MSVRIPAIFLVLSAIVGRAQTNLIDERPAQPRSAAAIAADEAARRALATPMPDREFACIPLSGAIDALREKTGVKVFVNWKSMEGIGIRRDIPVTVGLRGKTLAKALDTLLLVAGAERGKWGVEVDEGVIVVSSKDDLSKNVSVRVYDVRDMIGRPADDERQRRVTALVSLIENQIDSPSWKERGGQVGAIRELNGQLIVTQTPENQQQLIRLLGDVKSLFVDPAQHYRP